jgi:hypothetical protein
MADERAQNAAEEPGFFDGRFLIRIKTWDWPLSVGLSSDLTPPEHRFRGGLHYVRTFDIAGQIAAPKAFRGRPVRVWISPFDESLKFGPKDYPEVGCFYFRHPELRREGLSLTILLPEDAITATATCLASVWKYLHVWTFNEDAEQASIKSYSFSADYHPNLKSWVDAD